MTIALTRVLDFHGDFKIIIMDYNWDFLIVFGVILFGVFIYAGGKKMKKTKNAKAMDILNERYAKGELTKEEYEEIKKTINSKK